MVKTPPSSGPMADETPVTAPQTPKAMPRSFPWKVWASSASEVANTVAPPTPWTARQMISSMPELEMPHSSEPTVKIARPMPNMRRRPKMSASEPAGSRKAASDSE